MSMEMLNQVTDTIKRLLIVLTIFEGRELA